MSKNPIVCYLFTKFDKTKSLNSFIKNYKKYKPGHNHNLIICYKLLKKKNINTLEKKFQDIEHKVFVDSSDRNDWDFGTYSRLSSSYPNRAIFFMNSHSYPVSSNWLKKIMSHYKKKTIIAASGSYESITNEVKLKKFHHIFSFFIKKNKAKKSFSNFPNPHLNTSSFLINSDDFNDFIKKQRFNNKYETWKIESGYNSLTNYFKRRKFKLLVVNSEGKKFLEDKWMYSETYYYKEQKKTIISDKHSRKYLTYGKKQKIISQKSVWGV